MVGLSVSSERALAAAVVARFFDAIRRESLNDLGELLTEDSTQSSGLGGTTQVAAKVWASRFKRLDYRHPPGQEPYRASELGLFTASDLEHLGGARQFHLHPGPGELLAVIEPLGLETSSGPRHFGRRLELVLGPDPQGLKIRRLFEEFRLP